MIAFHYETDFLLTDEDKFQKWIAACIEERSLQRRGFELYFLRRCLFVETECRVFKTRYVDRHH